MSDSFGQRGQNAHYMKNISYSVVKAYRSVYPISKMKESKDHFESFYNESAIFKEFIDYCYDIGILGDYNANLAAASLSAIDNTQLA